MSIVASLDSTVAIGAPVAIAAMKGAVEWRFLWSVDQQDYH